MDAPETLRNQPKTEYVASLLGQFNALDSKVMESVFQLKINENQKTIIYHEEIELNSEGIEAKIIDLRYRGKGYIIRGVRNNVKFILYNNIKHISDQIQSQLKNYRTVES